MTVVVLHLSDIHIRTATNPILTRGASIAAATFPSLPEASHVFIVCSGDVAYSGKREEYEAASSLFSDIKQAIRAENACPISFVFAPGNHDCNFDKDNGARKMLVASMERSDCQEVDDSVIEHCTSIQSEYFEFRDALEGNSVVTDDKLWRTNVFEVEGKKIVFDSLNISWVSKIREDIGKIFFPVERYASQTVEQADVRLLVMHHPLNWFNQSIYRPFRTFVRKLSNIVITGHEHQGTVGLIEDAETESSATSKGVCYKVISKITVTRRSMLSSLTSPTDNLHQPAMRGAVECMRQPRRAPGSTIETYLPREITHSLCNLNSKKRSTTQVPSLSIPAEPTLACPTSMFILTFSNSGMGKTVDEFFLALVSYWIQKSPRMAC